MSGDVTGALAAKFAERKAEALAALGPMAAAPGPLSPEQVAEAQGVTHRLAGVAGMFGEADLGDLARAVDDATRETPVDVADVAARLRAVVAALEAA
ncbi:Hpt domain-containing protein [Phenylobacterium sp. J367]|uniref:Hpt domain-containing protein n=1 Tax=Phenylobacterium sp. J367 TaxID=2898435 RepID=UPI0021511857|nr:Hpt domain-containing protein [Phenylobacterium sp. J367]MCR5877389.1 Hpt domain-containing protein [Phenylobacterium sp. J367]